MANGDYNNRFIALFGKLIDKSEDQEHIPFMVAALIFLLWGVLSGIFLRGWPLTVSLSLLGIIVLALYVTYAKFAKKKKARKLLFDEIIDYFKANLDSKRYIVSSNDPLLEVVGIDYKKDKTTVIISTPQNDAHFKKNMTFNLIRMDNRKYNGKPFEFPTTIGYIKIVEVGKNSQAVIIDIIPTEKNDYKERLKQLKNNKSKPIKDLKIKTHIEEEFTNASLSDLENAYNLLLKIRDAEG